MRYLPTKCLMLASGLRKCEILTHKGLMLASGLRKCEILTHKVFDAGVRSEEVRETYPQNV